MHPSRDHHLPPDPDAYRHAPHPKGRIIVIAPTRAACETIELALGIHVDTLLEREHGDELRQWAADGQGIRHRGRYRHGQDAGHPPIAESILREPLSVGVVNREREATPETPTWNVVIVTTGIARRWFQDDLITARDTHHRGRDPSDVGRAGALPGAGQARRLPLHLVERDGGPHLLRQYLNSSEVLATQAFDPSLKAKVEVLPQQPEEFLNERYVRRLIKEKRGVAVFVPTRAEVEKLAAGLGAQWPRLTTAFYHGGEPIRVIRPFLEGEVERPFLLAMTAAGQSALNVRGLDTVVIYDARYGNVVDRGRNVLHRLHLGANEILQMAGRVHGRVPNGEVTILSDRSLDFASLRPTPPEFQLAGDAERVAITCAAIGVDARRPRSAGPARPNRRIGAAVELLTARGLVENGRLTSYGREVEALPVERSWGELLVHADDELIPMVAVCSNIDSLHRMTREERDLHGVLVNGSDHLTAYNLFAEAVNQHGYLGQVYGLPRHLFEDGLAEWAERRGVLVKAIEDAALGLASVYRSLELPLPKQLPYASKEIRQRWADLLARIMPFDLVIDERTVDGHEARVSKTSVAGSWGAVAGSLRFFADRFGTPAGGDRGHHSLLRSGAAVCDAWPAKVVLLGPRKHQRLVVERRRSYFGFDLETEVEPVGADPVPSLRPAARDGSPRRSDRGEPCIPINTVSGAPSRSGRALATLRRSLGATPGGPRVDPGSSSR